MSSKRKKVFILTSASVNQPLLAVVFQSLCKNQNLEILLVRKEGLLVKTLPLVLVQMTVPKGDFIFRLVASGYRDDQDRTSWKFRTEFVRTFELS